ncbi:MAG: hypothetical protein KDA88_21230 [Planctomycetaceae bacterium]|nr:hypothetical protein [Planctomycetaceae bacterium]MCB9951901.1 hypothetical protein [Planctomycetaceae bacterium]
MSIRITACLFLALCVASAHSEDPVLLQYKFQEGQVVRYSVSDRDDYDIQVAQQKDAPFTDQKSVKQYRVVKVNDDGSAVLEVMFESVKLTIRSAGETKTLDTQAAANGDDPVFSTLQEIVGKPHVQVTAAPNGQLSEVKPLVERAGQPDEISKNALDAFITLPSQPIAVGTAWREDFNVPIRVNPKLSKAIKLQRRFYFQSLEDGKATITFETKILSPVNDPDDEIQLIQRPTRGRIVLDMNRGIVVEKTVSLDNTVTGFGGIASSMTLKKLHQEVLLNTQVAAAEGRQAN